MNISLVLAIIEVFVSLVAFKEVVRWLMVVTVFQHRMHSQVSI